MIQRRPWAIGSLFAMLLAACGGQGPSATPAPEEAVTITFWHGQSGVLGERLKGLIDQFNSSHKIQVVASFQGSYDDLYKKVIAAIQSGTQPDMAMVSGPPQAAAYLKARALTPTQDFVDGPDGYKADQLRDFQPVVLDDSRLVVDGKKKLVSWPFSKSLPILYYNPAILKQAGISAPPKTWDEFRQQLLTVKQKTSVTPFEWTPELYYFWIPLLRANGGDVLSTNLDKAAFNTDAGVSALQYHVDLVNKDKTGVVTKGFDWQNDFAKGKVAFAASTSVSRPFIELAMPADGKFEVGMAPLPTAQKSGNTMFGNNTVIFSKAPQNRQRAAWLFMKWLTETDQTVKWSLDSSGGYVPVRQSALEAPAFKDKATQDPRVRIATEALKDAQGVPGSPDWQSIQPILNDAIKKAIDQKASAKDALAEAERKVNDILKGY